MGPGASAGPGQCETNGMARTSTATVTTPDTDHAVVAAGAVVTRRGPEGAEVLLVHRPKYDDWAYPKGKQDPGEHVTATAVREVLEETGVEIRLGRPLPHQQYAVSGGRSKIVHYWVGHVLGDDDLSGYAANQEIDQLAWFPLAEAAEQLSYADDVELLDAFRDARKRSTPLLVLRHAQAMPREDWSETDSLRPLSDRGLVQAEALVPLLHAYGVSRVLTSPSVRCVQTVQPYAEEQVLEASGRPEFSEEDFDRDAASLVLRDLLAEKPRKAEPTVLCTHRPVLPEVLELLAQDGDEPPLGTAELFVLHHRKARIHAVERHRVG